MTVSDVMDTRTHRRCNRPAAVTLIGGGRRIGVPRCRGVMVLSEVWDQPSILDANDVTMQNLYICDTCGESDVVDVARGLVDHPPPAGNGWDR